MITFDLEEIIHRPVEAVWAFMENDSNVPLWQHAVIKHQTTSTGPLGVGGTGIHIRHLMGQHLETSWQVTEHQPCQRYSAKSTSGPVSYEFTYILEPLERSTRLHLHFHGDPKGVFKVAEPFLAASLKKEITEDHARLKELLERQSS